LCNFLIIDFAQIIDDSDGSKIDLMIGQFDRWLKINGKLVDKICRRQMRNKKGENQFA